MIPYMLFRSITSHHSSRSHHRRAEEDEEEEEEVMPSEFFKIGKDKYINMARVSQVSSYVGGQELSVYFGKGANDYMVLNEEESRKLREYLESTARLSA